MSRRRSLGDQLVFLSWRKAFGSIPPIEIDAEVSEEQPTSTPTKLTENHDSLIRGIGEYRLIKPLGTGKFSDVMLATHYETQSLVAIKVCHHSLASNYSIPIGKL